MKTIKISETIMKEELDSLSDNKTIDFINSEFNGINIIIKIKGIDTESKYEKVVRKNNNLSKIKRGLLTENILDRYDNEEYWDYDIINNSDYDK